MNKPVFRLLTGATFLMLMAGAAEAHVGIGDTSGFSHGFLHPLSGLDHILAMVLAGLYAAQLGGRAFWLVPTSFVCLMVVGGGLGVAGIPVPFIELGIGLSIVVLGAAVAFGVRIAPVAAMALVGFFAIFHGHAHGTEMPETAAGLAYGPGFVAATALLQLIGIGVGLASVAFSGKRGDLLVRSVGALAAMVGVSLVTGVI